VKGKLPGFNSLLTQNFMLCVSSTEIKVQCRPNLAIPYGYATDIGNYPDAQSVFARVESRAIMGKTDDVMKHESSASKLAAWVLRMMKANPLVQMILPSPQLVPAPIVRRTPVRPEPRRSF
jgi:hypothetical protein